jgi:transposase
MNAAARLNTQFIGALPVITQYFERLDLAETLNQAIPWEGEVPIGTLAEILIANRLVEPEAMYRVGEWAEKAGLTDYYGVAAPQLNDDRLGRMLERVAVHAECATAALVLQAISVFDVDVGHVHFDVTSAELYGAYEVAGADRQASPTPLPTYGHTKSGRKNVKQVQLGLSVANDGGVPVCHFPLDGNASESLAHLENLRRLNALLPRRRLLTQGDSKMDTPETLLRIEARRGQFLCAGAFTPELQRRYLGVRHKLHRIDYYPKRQAQRPPEARDQYKVHEVKERLQGEVDGRKVRLDYRLIFVWSQAKARQEASTRARHVAKIRAEFEFVEKSLGKYKLTTDEAIRRRLEAAKAKYAEGALFRYTLRPAKAGKFQFQWEMDAEALREWQLLEGVYVLKTNVPSRKLPAVEVLRTYKEQSQVERRFHHLKGPLAVTPLFLEKPERIAGLLSVLVWALTVLALMEREVRRNLKGKPLYGLYPERRPSPAPTGPSIIKCFDTLTMVIIMERGKTTRRLAEASSTQRALLKLLGIPPDSLQTFRRRCGT